MSGGRDGMPSHLTPEQQQLLIADAVSKAVAASTENSKGNISKYSQQTFQCSCLIFLFVIGQCCNFQGMYSMVEIS